MMMKKALFSKLFSYNKNLYADKGHIFLYNPQLSPMVSFTMSYKGHTIRVGPERARRRVPEFGS
jgi:hypothetical protein